MRPSAPADTCVARADLPADLEHCKSADWIRIGQVSQPVALQRQVAQRRKRRELFKRNPGGNGIGRKQHA